MGDTDVVSLEVTTAELASMSSEELRQAVSRGRRADEFEKELGLVRTMNRMLMDSMAEVKAQLAQEKSKRSNAGIAHENGRLEANPEDDELPALRLANESLLTRQIMLEAQVTEAARYSDHVSSELHQTQKELRAFKDSTQRAEAKCQLLQEELDQLQSAATFQVNHSHNSGQKTNSESMAKLEEENRDLSEKCSALEDKCAKRKEEVTNLRSNVTYLKSKISELISRIQKSDAVNDTALQRLKDQLASDVSQPPSLASSSSDSIKVEPLSSICGIMDTEQSDLLTQAATEIETLRSSENGISLRTYFTDRLNAIEEMKTNKPRVLSTPIVATSGSTPLITITESGTESNSSSTGTSFNAALSPTTSNSPTSLTSSTGISISQSSSSSGHVNWHEYDAAFLILSVSLVQKLTTTLESLNRKRRELVDLQEDFNELKSRAAQATPRNAGGSRKMSMETQQISFQKKITDLEKNVASLTAASTEKEANLSAAKKDVALLTSQVEESTASLQKMTEDLERKQNELERALSEEKRLLIEMALEQSRVKELTDSLATRMSSFEALERDLESTRKSLESEKEEAKRQTSLVSSHRAEIQQLNGESSSKTSRILDLESTMEKAALEAEEKAHKIDHLETELKHSNVELMKLTEDLKEKETSLQQRIEQLEATESSLETCRREIQDLIASQDRLKTELKQLTDAGNEKDALLKQNQEKLESTTSDLETCKQDLASTQDRLNAELKQLSDSGIKKDTQIKQLQEQLETTTSSLETCRRDIQDLTTAQDRLNEEFKQLTLAGKEKDALLKQRQEKLETATLDLETCKRDLTETRDRLNAGMKQLADSVSEKDTQIKQLQGQLETTTALLETCRREIQDLATTHDRLKVESSDLHKELESKKSEFITLKSNLESDIEQKKADLTRVQSDIAARVLTIETLRSESQAQSEQISGLTATQRRLENEVQMKEEEAREQVRNLTSELLQTKAAKDAIIEQLQAHLDKTNKALEETSSKLAAVRTEMDAKVLELGESKIEVLRLRTELADTQKSLGDTKKSLEDSRESLEALRLQMESKSKELESTEAKLSSAESEVSKLNASLSSMSVAESALQKEIVHLQMKARELEVLQKKQPEIADEALEAEERAVTKWLEQALTKEKAVSSSNPIAILASQLSLGNSPGALSAQLNAAAAAASSGAAGGLQAGAGSSNAAGGRKISNRLGDSFKLPSFVSNVINLAKKDAFPDHVISKYEEYERDGTMTEPEALRALEQCIATARSAGLRIFGVTAQLLYQGNRRSIVDLSLEVIRIQSMARTNVRSHPELNILWPGKEEAKLDAKSPDRVLIKWVNTWLEDHNNSHPTLPPRPLVTNLGKDLSDGKVLGIVMAGINPDWSALGDPNSIDLVRKIVTSLQQAVWMRLIPPFLDSHLPILRGEESILSILLAHLLEWNTGLSSPLAKLPVVQTTSSTASMLANTHTPMRHQARAVSGSNMLDSPLHTPAKTASAASAKTSLSSRQPGKDLSSSSKSDFNEVTVKPVEETRRWGFW